MTKDDFTRLIAVTHLNEILDQAAESSGLSAATCFTNALSMSIAEVKAYLSKLFDMTTEFAKTTGQNENIMRAVIHIALFNLHFTINPHDVPEMRRKAYEAMTGSKGELAAVRDGVLNWDLTANSDEATEGMNRTEIFSARKFISKPFTDPQVNQ